MRSYRTIKTFTDRYPLVGPAFWIVSIQYFIVQLLVAADSSAPYSWIHNTISDLGNTSCGVYDQRFVCSPEHTFMNLSLIVLGSTMMSGAILIYQEFKENASSAVGFSFMGLAGLGTLLVGAFPENSASTLHQLGAALPFIVGNLSLLVLASTLDIPSYFRRFTMLSGILSLSAFGFFASHHYSGLGIGGMERVVAYPQTIWIIVFGLYISHNHMREISTRT